MAFIAEDLAATTNVDGKTRQTIAPRFWRTFKRSPSSGFRSPIRSLLRLWGWCPRTLFIR